MNGYRAAVDRFASNEDLAVNLIVTFTRDNVIVSKKIPVTVKAITEAEVQDQLDLMTYAKEHYFDGINDNLYADKDSITGNLHAFQELTAEKNGSTTMQIRLVQVLSQMSSLQIHGKWKVQDTTNSNLPIMQ